MKMEAQTPSISYALRGLLVWALAALITVCGLALLWHLLRVVGIDPRTGVDPRAQPLAAVAMALTALMVVLSVFYASITASLLLLSPFVSRKELKAHFVEQLGAGKVLGPFHSWLFGRIFRRQ